MTFGVNPAPFDDPLPFDIPTEEISFQRSQNYCVCFVDLVGSTKLTLEISDPKKVRLYYTIFLNAVATVAKSFGAKMIKNAGDALIFYFPEATDPANRTAFRDVLECCATIIAGREIVNIKLQSAGIESISYRISADYGSFEVASSMSCRNEDLFGPTMNMCSKINSIAGINEIVIGGDLYRILKALSLDTEYGFREIGSYSADSKHQYPVYILSKYVTIKEDRIVSLFDKTRSRIYPRFPLHSDKKDVTLHDYKDVQGSKKPCNIMLVDDDPDTLLVYKSFLSSEGYNVEVFTDPQEALAYFAKFSYSYYDLVIMDIRMPYMNGFQLYQRLKAINKEVKVLFLSALEIVEEVAVFIPEITVSDILKKPVTRDGLIGTVKKKFNAPPVLYQSTKGSSNQAESTS